jgi:ABC-type phosphate transport system substrate-binding protein
MKYLFFVAIIYSGALAASTRHTKVIKITGTKFPFAIMQQWIEAYNKIHPEIKFELSKAIPCLTMLTF